MASAAGVEASSGKLGRRRIIGDDLRWLTRGTVAVVALQCVRGLMARQGGRGRCGELVDTVGWCRDDGGYGYDGETAAAASAMASGERGREQVGGVRCRGGRGEAAEALRGIALARATAGRQRGGVASSAVSRCPSFAYWQR